MSLQFKRILSFVFLLVFSFYITPKEIYHAFTHHIDTEHSLLHGHGLQISNQHHHCELLKVDQQFYSSDIAIPYFDFSQECFVFIIEKTYYSQIYFYSEVCSNAPLRGPPIS